jgi:hypothetical protein
VVVSMLTLATTMAIVSIRPKCQVPRGFDCVSLQMCEFAPDANDGPCKSTQQSPSNPHGFTQPATWMNTWVTTWGTTWVTIWVTKCQAG